MELPKTHRPDCWYKKCEPGLDLPTFFLDGLQQIDSGLHVVWHEYDLLSDNLMNSYYGSLEDPREPIHHEYGQLNFGFVLTRGNGEPKIEKTDLEKQLKQGNNGAWHVWKLNRDVGWYHVLRIESRDGDYLRLVLNRLWKYLLFTDKYGFLKYNKLMADVDEDTKRKMASEYSEVLEANHDENKWLMRKVMENIERGETRPTNPKREQLISYPGQSHRSRVIRPLEDDDKESGIVTLT